VSLRDRIQTDITAAMRGGDALRRDVLRMASNAGLQPREAQPAPPDRRRVPGVLTREVKTRRESVEAYTKGGRADLAAKEQAEIDILTEYLPQALSDTEIDTLIEEAVATTGATNARDLGKVMGWLAPRTRGRADGKVVSGKVASVLARADLAVHDETGH
jgi:uncharacterized protein YqeY